MNKSFIKALIRERFDFIENVSMKEYTSIASSGKVRILVFPEDIYFLKILMKLIDKFKLEYFILGNGSNLIVADEGYDGVVISLSRFNNIKMIGDRVYVQSGVKLFDLHKFCKEELLAGLEFMFGIPGTVGGAVYMNAGAYNHEICEFIESVTIMTSKGKIFSLKGEEIDFSYRHSGIDGIIISVTLMLYQGCFKEIRDLQFYYYKKRRNTQPLEFHSAGSVFKRQKNIIPAQLIDKLGLKGVKIGGAEISCKHAGFIVNNGGTSTDILKLIDYIKDRVRVKYNVILAEEVIILKSKEKQ